jgi:hypothetical protein
VALGVRFREDGLPPIGKVFWERAPDALCLVIAGVSMPFVQVRMRWFLGSARCGLRRRVPRRQTDRARQETPVGMHMYGGIPGRSVASGAAI